MLCAFYLGNDATVDDYTNYLSLDSYVYFTTYTEEEIKEYLKDYMYMVGKTTFSTSGTSLTMKQLTSMLRVTYNNATASEQTLYEMCFSGSNYWIGTYMYYDVVNETYSINGYSPTGGNMYFDEGLTVGANETVDLYFLCFPYKEFTSSGYLYVTIDGEELWLKTADITTTKFEVGYRYWFDVTKKDTGLEWTNYELTFDDYTTIYKGTNDALCEVLLDQIAYSFIDEEGNLQMPTDVVKATTSLEISGNYDIESIEGLVWFTSLKTLVVNYTSITSLDLSSFPNLQNLNCQNNSLTSLNVSSNTYLVLIYCENNQLTSLNLSNNKNLFVLGCGGNQLTSLDVSGNTILSLLSCGVNPLTSLNLNTSLVQLYCSYNQLTSLDVSNNIYLTDLECSYNQLTSLDVSNNISLDVLYCSSNQLTNLDLSNNTYLRWLRCYSNQLTSLDVSNNISLEDFWCYSNQLTSLDITKNTDLNELMCGNQIDSDGSDLNLTLMLTKSQNELWESRWQYDHIYNNNVTLSVKDDE